MEPITLIDMLDLISAPKYSYKMCGVFKTPARTCDVGAADED